MAAAEGHPWVPLFHLADAVRGGTWGRAGGREGVGGWVGARGQVCSRGERAASCAGARLLRPRRARTLRAWSPSVEGRVRASSSMLLPA